MRLIAFAAATAALGCASIGAPPGGPMRTTPPAILAITPDSGAVNVRDRAVVYQFDAVVSDRPQGRRDLESTFLISPSDGAVRVSWKRDRIEVRPRRGFRDSVAYSVTMLPGIADLRGNAIAERRTIVFSTGPTIPAFAVLGRVFDWVAERPIADAAVEVIRRPDSLPYVGRTDSTGQFAVGPLEEGRYTVIAFMDGNNNGARDITESWDSLSVLVRGTSPFLELLAAPRDTVPPRILTATATDSLTVTLSFDRLLDPALPLSPVNFSVLRQDSTPLRVLSARTRADVDAERARADSLRADSIARADTTRPPQPPPAPGAVTTPTPTVPVMPKPSRSPPTRDVILGLDPANPLQPMESYRAIARNTRGLLGAVGSSERAFTVPRPRVDSTARPDSVARPDSIPPGLPPTRP